MWYVSDSQFVTKIKQYQNNRLQILSPHILGGDEHEETEEKKRGPEEEIESSEQELHEENVVSLADPFRYFQPLQSELNCSVFFNKKNGTFFKLDD